MISAIVALCAGAWLVAVAEGVETYEQLRQLQALGCDRAQGYLLARPAVADLAAELLTGNVTSFWSSTSIRPDLLPATTSAHRESLA